MENKDTRVSGDGLSREEKIKRIYEVIGGSEFYDKYGLSGHTLYIIHIGDVIRWLDDYVENKYGDVTNYVAREKYRELLGEVLKDWEDTRKPIEESDAIDYVYSLLETNQPTTS